MVTKGEAWYAADGSIFATEIEATRHDAMAALGKIGSFNHATCAAIICNAQAIVEVLTPYAAAHDTAAETVIS